MHDKFTSLAESGVAAVPAHIPPVELIYAGYGIELDGAEELLKYADSFQPVRWNDGRREQFAEYVSTLLPSDRQSLIEGIFNAIPRVKIPDNPVLDAQTGEPQDIAFQVSALTFDLISNIEDDPQGMLSYSRGIAQTLGKFPALHPELRYRLVEDFAFQIHDSLASIDRLQHVESCFEVLRTFPAGQLLQQPDVTAQMVEIAAACGEDRSADVALRRGTAVLLRQFTRHLELAPEFTSAKTPAVNQLVSDLLYRADKAEFGTNEARWLQAERDRRTPEEIAERIRQGIMYPRKAAAALPPAAPKP